MIKVVWHYATIASIEIFHNKQEIGQHEFRLRLACIYKNGNYVQSY